MDFNLFNGWEGLAVVLLKTGILYGYTLVLIRLGGMRTTGKIATFDFVSIIIMGPLIATTTLSSSVALLDGMAALTAFVAVQWIVSFLATRNKRFARIVTSPPSVLFANSRFVHENMLARRIHEDEIIAKIREGGHASTDSVKAVILESTGDMSVIASRIPEQPAKDDQAVLGMLQP